MLGLFFNVLSMGVCTIMHWQTSSQLVQELNVCIVHWQYSCYFQSFASVEECHAAISAHNGKIVEGSTIRVAKSNWFNKTNWVAKDRER